MRRLHLDRAIALEAIYADPVQVVKSLLVTQEQADVMRRSSSAKLSSRRLAGEPHRKGAAGSGFAHHGDVAAQHAAESPADGQPEPRAAIFARGGVIRLVEDLKQAANLLGVRPMPVSFDGKFQPLRVAGW